MEGRIDRALAAGLTLSSTRLYIELQQLTTINGRG